MAIKVIVLNKHFSTDKPESSRILFVVLTLETARLIITLDRAGLVLKAQIVNREHSRPSCKERMGDVNAPRCKITL